MAIRAVSASPIEIAGTRECLQWVETDISKIAQLG
jgi:hypothetical protein